MSDAYDRELQQLAMDVGQELGYGDFLKEGVYCVLGGPSFETIAECRMLHRLGADAVGECVFFGLLGSWNNSVISSFTDRHIGLHDILIISFYCFVSTVVSSFI